MSIEKSKNAIVTLKTGQIIQGFCNGKTYNGFQYIANLRIAIEKIESVEYKKEEKNEITADQIQERIAEYTREQVFSTYND